MMNFERLSEYKNDRFEAISTKHGEGTEFEAISRIDLDPDTGMWSGFLVFKDARFSPAFPEMPTFTFAHLTPRAGNGVLADQRAADTWRLLVHLFKGLMNPPSDQ